MAIPDTLEQLAEPHERAHDMFFLTGPLKIGPNNLFLCEYPDMTSTNFDESRRFLFEEADIRGETVHLESAYQDILAIHQYAPPVERLLGELLAAAVLLSTNLKFEGKLILQARSEGQIPLLMAECDHRLQVRGIARGAERVTGDDDGELLGSGHLAITVDPVNGQRYQGVVALQPGSLADNLNAYFKQSEQLQSRIWLAAAQGRAAGLLLQQLPEQVVVDQSRRREQWDRVSLLASTLRNTELLETGTSTLLHSLYPEDPLRLFTGIPVRFSCSCSRERTLDALASLSPAELEELLAETGCITMDCEFCNAQYAFYRQDLGSVLEGGEVKTLH